MSERWPEPNIIEYMRNNYIPVTESGCWLWTGQLMRGYGAIKLRKGGVMSAHRFFYMDLVGAIPPGALVCHKCDTPSCVNPNHLFLGTASDNMTDMLRKGRNGLGPRKRLTPEVAASIRNSRNSIRATAKIYGVSRRTVSDIRSGKTWATS